MYRTDSVVKTLMAYTINTGLLTRWVPRHVDQRPKTNFSSILTVATLFTVGDFSCNISHLTLSYVMTTGSWFFHPGLWSRWQFTSLWENVCFTMAWRYFTYLFLTGYVNSVLAMWVYLVCHGGFHLHTVSTSGWTVGTTSVSGHRPRTRVTHSPWLRSELRHRVRPSGPNPSKLISPSLSVVRPHPPMHRTKSTPKRGMHSKVQNWYDRYALLISRPDRYLLYWRIQASLLNAKIESRLSKL